MKPVFHGQSATRTKATGAPGGRALKPRVSGNTAKVELFPWEPLWKRAPTHGDDGHPLSDFMMVIPRLREKGREDLLDTLDRLQTVFFRYHHAVVFADLNPRLNVLWVSIRPIPGMCLELATAIHQALPEARLVGQRREW